VLKPASPTDRLFGFRLFDLAYRVVETVHAKGLFRACSYVASALIMVVLAYAWKARKFLHWRLSRKISMLAYWVRDGICRKCEGQRVVHDGRYADRESRYCIPCGCNHNRWSELTVKNTRRGHICPHLRFPEQAEQLKQKEEMEKLATERAAQMAKNPTGGCKGCGGNGRGHKLEDWHERAGLLATSTRGVP
jgi:hypothetical protein